MLSNKYVAYTIFVLLILVIAYNIHFFSSKDVPTKEAEKSFRQPVPIFPQDPSDVALRAVLNKDSTGWGDPFALGKVRKVEKKDVRMELRLNGILKRDGDEGRALINGKVYGINNAIGNSIIRNIKKESVVISTNGISEEIYLYNKSLIKETKK